MLLMLLLSLCLVFFLHEKVSPKYFKSRSGKVKELSANICQNTKYYIVKQKKNLLLLCWDQFAFYLTRSKENMRLVSASDMSANEQECTEYH